MIGSLRGTLAARLGESEVVVEVGGVGYRLTVSPPTAAALGPSGSEVRLFVHTHVREDAIVLYGFCHDDERRCFEVLLGAHGVGPALALAILSQLSPAALTTALLEEDADALCAVPGVGRKTAARLLIDLKSRLDLPDLSPAAANAGLSAVGVARAEVRAALSDLGYGPDEIRNALERMGPEAADERVEEVLRGALRELATR
jgi:holliday junction DNA helicase RuvA